MWCSPLLGMLIKMNLYPKWNCTDYMLMKAMIDFLIYEEETSSIQHLVCGHENMSRCINEIKLKNDSL